MALRNITKVGDPVLRERCRPVTEFDARLGELLDDMADTMYDAEGVGLMVTQVGVMRRLAVVDTGDEDGLVELVNPRIVRTKGEVVGVEGCLSVPDRQGYVARPYKVTVAAVDRYGKPFTVKAEGFAPAFCHEIDHLDGVLYVDKLTEPPKEGR